MQYNNRNVEINITIVKWLYLFTLFQRNRSSWNFGYTCMHLTALLRKNAVHNAGESSYKILGYLVMFYSRFMSIGSANYSSLLLE